MINLNSKQIKKQEKKARREKKVKELEDTEFYLKSVYIQTDHPTKRVRRAWKRLVRQTLNKKNQNEQVTQRRSL